MVNLSAFVREQNEVGIIPRLTAEVMEQVKRRPRPRLKDRAMCVLVEIVREIGWNLDKPFSVFLRSKIYAISYTVTDAELTALLEILNKDGLIEFHSRLPPAVRLTPAGLIQAEELSQAGSRLRSGIRGHVVRRFDG